MHSILNFIARGTGCLVVFSVASSKKTKTMHIDATNMENLLIWKPLNSVSGLLMPVQPANHQKLATTYFKQMLCFRSSRQPKIASMNGSTRLPMSSTGIGRGGKVRRGGRILSSTFDANATETSVDEAF